MILKKATIANFLSITGQIEFDLDKNATILLGANDHGKGYVGSAYGAENILGRWAHYAKSGHGGNKFLRQRNPTNFRFSILELVAPSLPPEEVIKREQSWKKRLSTIQPLGLNEN